MEQIAYRPQWIAIIIKTFDEADFLDSAIVKQPPAGGAGSCRRQQAHHQIVLQALPGDAGLFGGSTYGKQGFS